MDIIRLFNPALFSAAIIAYVACLLTGIKRNKYDALKVFGVFWIIIITQLIVLSVELYSEIHSQELGHGDSILRPLGAMLYLSIYACTLTAITTTVFCISQFKKTELWTEIIVVLASTSMIILASSILYLIKHMVN